MDRIASAVSKRSRFRRGGEPNFFIVPSCTDGAQTGMPIGLSLVSGRYRDQKLVTVAKEVAKVFSGAHAGRIRKLPGAPEELL